MLLCRPVTTQPFLARPPFQYHRATVNFPHPFHTGKFRPAILVVAALYFGLTGLAHGRDSMLPNPKLTPGKVANGDKDLQGVTVEMEHVVFARYDIPWTRRSEFKVDHLIPRELGGADHIKNLWPQRLNIRPYHARRKELLTARLVALVAARQLTLSEAQEQMREDWIVTYVKYCGMVALAP